MKIERDVTGGGRVEDAFAPPAADAEAQAQAEVQKLAAVLAGFRRSGWGSWTEWLAQAPAVRQLAEIIGDQVSLDRMRALAALVGMAGRGPAMIAEVLDDPGARQEAAEAEVVGRARGLASLGGY